MDSPSRIPTVEDVKTLGARGPWTTKSGGQLNVMFGLPLSEVEDRYFHYDPKEVNQISGDIRGLRIYTVRDLPKGSVGGTEYHRIRQEKVYALEGAVHWICEDLLGSRRGFVLDGKVGVWMPPFILHTYEVIEEGSGLFVVANTLFDPEDPRTHDTYSLEAFREMQTQVATSK